MPGQNQNKNSFSLRKLSKNTPFQLIISFVFSRRVEAEPERLLSLFAHHFVHTSPHITHYTSHITHNTSPHITHHHTLQVTHHTSNYTSPPPLSCLLFFLIKTNVPTLPPVVFFINILTTDHIHIIHQFKLLEFLELINSIQLVARIY